MDCDFSETQYSFCFTFEYLKQFFPIIPLPIFPNTVMEGRTGGGYDVKIDGNIYFQFKIPEHITRMNVNNSRQWAVFNESFYRIKINTNSRQFELLKDLQDPNNNVYYATPDFHTDADISTNYQFDQIVDSSSLFPIQNFPAFGSGHHQLVYHPSYSWGKLFSEPIEIRKEKIINPYELFQNTQKQKLTIIGQAIQIFEILKSKEYSIQGDIPLNQDEPVGFVKAIHNLLLTNYNIHWYPVISNEQ